MISGWEALAIGADVLGLLVSGYMAAAGNKDLDRDAWLFVFVLLQVGLCVDLFLAFTD